MPVLHNVCDINSKQNLVISFLRIANYLNNAVKKIISIITKISLNLIEKFNLLELLVVPIKGGSNSEVAVYFAIYWSIFYYHIIACSPV